MLELRHLELLRAVAARGSISAAAEAMSYTPSAASQQLGLMERKLGLRLVIRGSRGATLTPAGMTLLEHAHAIIGRVQAAESEMHALTSLGGGRLRVAVFPSAGASFMPEVIADFRRRHAAVELALTEAETDDSLVMLQRREVDLAVGYDFEGEQPPSPAIRRFALFDDPMRLLLPSSHRLAKQRSVALSDLDQDSWIDSNPSRPCSRAFNAACAAAGFHPQIVYRSDDYATIHRLVATGVGIAIIPKLAINGHRADFAYPDAAPALPIRRVFAATTDANTPAAMAMCEILNGVIGRFLNGSGAS